MLKLCALCEVFPGLWALTHPPNLLSTPKLGPLFSFRLPEAAESFQAVTHRGFWV